MSDFKRCQVIRQLLVQSLVLAVAGGLLGLLLAHFGTAPLVGLSPVRALADFFTDVRVDGPAFAFCFLLSLAIGVIFGLAPPPPVAARPPASPQGGRRGGSVPAGAGGEAGRCARGDPARDLCQITATDCKGCW